MPTQKNNPSMHPDLECVLFTEAQIKKRVRELGREVRKTYGDGEFTIVSIINGAVMFTADLMREIDNPVRLDCIRISSYADRTKSVGTPQIVHSLTIDIAKRHVLLIDDILDTGKTISLVSGLVQKQGPASFSSSLARAGAARRPSCAAWRDSTSPRRGGYSSGTRT